MTPLEFYREYIDLTRKLVCRAKLEKYMDEAESYLSLLAVDDPARPDCRSRTRRDESKCKLSTWVGHQVIWHLLTLRTAEEKRGLGIPKYKVRKYYRDVGYNFEMSAEAETIVMMIRYDPEGCRVRFNRANAKEKLRWHMESLGWSCSKIEDVFEELMEIVR
jgi:hypothetical protein